MAAAPPVITCPRCSKKFKGKPELFGKRIRCPGCEKPFVVPSPDAKIDEEQLKNVLEFKEEEAEAPKKSGDAKVKVSEAEVKKAVQIKAAHALFPDDGPSEYTIAHNADDHIHRCPNCANPMESEDAVVCLHCGYNTSDRTWGKTEKTIENTAGDQFKWLLPGLGAALGILLEIIACLYFCLVLPSAMGEGWQWLGHESLKMWFVIISLSVFMWPLGLVAYNRLVLNPIAPEKEKE